MTFVKKARPAATAAMSKTSASVNPWRFNSDTSSAVTADASCATAHAKRISAPSAADSDSGISPRAIAATSSAEKNCSNALPCASVHSVLFSVAAAANVASSNRRLSIGRFSAASKSAQRRMTSGRCENTVA